MLTPLLVAVGLPAEGIGILIAVDAIPDTFATVLRSPRVTWRPRRWWRARPDPHRTSEQQVCRLAKARRRGRRRAEIRRVTRGNSPTRQGRLQRRIRPQIVRHMCALGLLS